MNNNRFIVVCFLSILIITIILYPLKYIMVHNNVIHIIPSASYQIKTTVGGGV